MLGAGTLVAAPPSVTNRDKARIRAKVGHPFHVLKNLFGRGKARRGWDADGAVDRYRLADQMALRGMGCGCILIVLIRPKEFVMPLQIANPVVVDKVERLARATGLNKTAAVEQAVDRLLREAEGVVQPAASLVALLEQFDRLPDRADAHDPLNWDERGLPA
ncbi:MAG: type II toxin-antitoxin system VapB family antitoxin [Azoarcus sp.]|nr:type II toxin-antitoxin system VapB family antitoxin [Azoarcus sp.]